MAYDNGYTAVTGGTLSAAQWNTHVRDNFTALFPYTTAGDLVYATSSSTLARLAGATADALFTYDFSANAPAWLEAASGNAYKYLRQNSGGNGFEFVAGGIKSYNVDISFYSYSSSTERDVPSGSVDVVVDVPSTIIVIGNAVGFCDTGGKGMIMTVYIDGSSTGNASTQFAGATKTSASIYGYASSVAVGTKTVKLREYAEFNFSAYTIAGISYTVLVIPE